MPTVKVAEIVIGGDNPLVLIAGPCVIESEVVCVDTAQRLKEITGELSIPFIFKSSFDKANRSSVHSYRGPGLEKGLVVLQRVKEKVGVPVLSDVHCRNEIEQVADILDIIQIPAFLSRQTDLILAAARTGKIVNVKKGQFMAPREMENVVDKIRSTGNENILLTERGTFFGYHNLVVDMRSLVEMGILGFPIIFDGTHSVQQPGGAGDSSGGDRQFVPYLVRAAVATGCSGIFLEVHPDPGRATCDGPNMLSLDQLPGLLYQVREIDRFVKKCSRT